MKYSTIFAASCLYALPAMAASNLYFDSSGGKIGIGTFTPSGSLDLANGGGLHISDGTPSSTANTLYSVGSVLQWNGAPVSDVFDAYPDTNTLLLLHFDNNFTDSSIFNNIIANTGVTFSSTISKFGGYSAFFNGLASTNTYLTSQSTPPINCSPNCTIDFWVNLSGNVPYIGSSSAYSEELVEFPGNLIGIQVTSGSTSGVPNKVNVGFNNNGVISQSYSFTLNT